MILLIGSLLAFIIITAYLHYYWIEEKNEYINHSLWALIRLTWFALAAFLYSTEWQHILALVLLQSAIYWVLFDLLLNLFRGLPWNYIGVNAYLDRTFKGLPDLQLIVKIILLIASVIITVKVI